MQVTFEETKTLKEKPNDKELGFGIHFTDYMFVMDYTDEKGWHNFKITPFAPISLNPATMVLHYAQETFEGLKAYRTKEGKILLFRPEMNAKRMIKSNERLCMATVPEEMFVEAIKVLVDHEREWVPHLEGTSLYIRPFMFATEVAVGVHPASSYKFVIILSPVGSYYPEGVNPVKIYVEDEYVRATKGGTGFTKCGGNYAASIIAQEKAEKLGYTQVLWLDGVERKYVEEVGTMNAMFIVDNEVYTAPIDGTVLPGITRDSCLALLKSWGYKVHEEHFSIDFLMKAAKEGRLQEAFGTGTAAVISPIGELFYKGEKQVINDFKTGSITQKLYDTITGIQYGELEDKFGWTQEV